ncbi:unnamed protein product, partial [Ectocarpus sp. 13 AM-2016]
PPNCCTCKFPQPRVSTQDLIHTIYFKRNERSYTCGGEASSRG